MAAVRVEEVLAAAEEREAERRRSVTVEKELELEFDLGNLLALDRNPPAAAAGLRGAGPRREALLRALARDNAQLLVARLWELPAERAGGAGGPVVARLPEPAFRLPREKPPPRPRPPTRWEQFARLKGIRRRKRTSLVWDEQAKEWRRRWGYRRAGGDPARAWLAEVPAGAHPEEDQFARLRREKRERVARNELNRLRNLARAHRAGPAAPLHPTGHQSREELGRAARVARLSTASLGRFQPRLPKEPPELPSRGGAGRKRRFEPLLGNLEAERSRQLELLRDMGSKKPALDITRAVNKQMRQEDAKAAAAKGKKQSQRGKRWRRQQRVGRSGKRSGARRQQQQQHRPAGSSSGDGKRKKA
ncbi:ribosome biogenesis regulatory protein homolog [Opisthocomus hoazin]|uniref:ribosome biogenesis regulatory protein homolog n=1 Tax=Opisthocomus hoazin TaxID=30419 RepID=UPI003F53DFA0